MAKKKKRRPESDFDKKLFNAYQEGTGVELSSTEVQAMFADQRVMHMLTERALYDATHGKHYTTEEPHYPEEANTWYHYGKLVQKLEGIEN